MGHREIGDNIAKFLQYTSGTVHFCLYTFVTLLSMPSFALPCMATHIGSPLGHLVVGLEMLSELVNEMNTPMESQSYTIHRKIAVSFRDKSVHVFVFVCVMCVCECVCVCVCVCMCGEPVLHHPPQDRRVNSRQVCPLFSVLALL
jgi:hypothetical protein